MKLFIFILPWLGILFVEISSGDSEVTSPHGAKSALADPMDPKLCRDFLIRTRAGLVSQLSSKLQFIKQRASCDGRSPTQDSQCFNTKVQELKVLHDVIALRVSAVARQLRFNGKEFFLENSPRNAIGFKMGRINAAQRQTYWRAFKVDQAKYYKKWIGSLAAAKGSNWQSCFQFHKGNIQLRERSRSSQVYLAVEKGKWKTRKQTQGCRRIIKSVRQGRQRFLESFFLHSKQKSRKLQTQGNLPPWSFFISKDTTSLSLSGRWQKVQEAHNLYKNALKKLKMTLESLNNSELSRLLSLDVVKKRLGGNEICENYQDFSWYGFAIGLGAGFVPGYDLYNSLFKEVDLNNQIFLANFIDYETWKKNHNENRSNIISNFSPLQLAAEITFFDKVMKVIKPFTGPMKRHLNSLVVKLKAKLFGKRYKFGHLSQKAKKALDRLVKDAEQTTQLEKVLESLNKEEWRLFNRNPQKALENLENCSAKSH